MKKKYISDDGQHPDKKWHMDDFPFFNGINHIMELFSPPTHTYEQGPYIPDYSKREYISLEDAPMKLLHTTAEQLQFILQNLDNGIIAQTISGVFLYTNPAAAMLLGFETPQDMMHYFRLSAHIMQDGYIYKDVIGTPIMKGDWPWENISFDTPQQQRIVNIFSPEEKFIKRLQIKSYITQASGEQENLIMSVITDITHIAQLEKQKDEFMSLASHELKTPITSMKVFTQVLQRLFETQKDPKSLQYLGKIEGQLNKLTVLVREMLEVSRLQTGRLQLHQELFFIDDLLKEIIEQMQVTTDEHTLVYVENVHEEVFADKERLGQVFVNLIGNAIKYSPPQTTITLDLHKKDNVIVIDITDQGIGISEDRLEHIFDRFAKNDDAKESTFPGMGVGLYIASEIIKRHNGTIHVTSAKDQGSTFSITLPVKKNEK